MNNHLKLTFVRNVWENIPKPLTSAVLKELINSEVTKTNLKKYRETGDEVYKKHLPAFMVNGVMTDDALVRKVSRIDTN